MMNPAEEAEVDRIMTEADYTEFYFTELIGAVKTPTMDVVSAEGMAPHEGREGVPRVGGGSCQRPSFSLTVTLKWR